MIAVWPETVVGPPELPELAPERQPSPVALVVAITMVVVCAAETLSALILTHGGPGEQAARSISLVAASARLYPDPGLFAPAQILSAAFVHQPLVGSPLQVLTALWSLIVDAALLFVIGRAWERTWGSPAMVTLVAVATPLVALIHLRQLGQVMPIITSASLVTAVLAATALALPGRRLRLRAAWWALTVVGVATWHLDLRLVAAAYVILEILRSALMADMPGERSIALVAALLIGATLGSAARLVFRR